MFWQFCVQFLGYIIDNAFDACFKLHRFDLVPQNVIGDYAFRGCNCLKEIKVNGKIKRIGKHIPCDVEFI